MSQRRCSVTTYAATSSPIPEGISRERGRRTCAPFATGDTQCKLFLGPSNVVPCFLQPYSVARSESVVNSVLNCSQLNN